MDAELRESLVRLIRRKFAGCPNVASQAEDIAHDAYAALRASAFYSAEKENFGYLSVACMRAAYRAFASQTQDFKNTYYDGGGQPLVSEEDVARELTEAENSAEILESLKTLREIERIVISQRYYGDFSFAKIAEANGLKLNTVLSHHYRALGKLRPRLTSVLGYGKEQYYE